MSHEQAMLMGPYLDEGYKLLREKYKCGAKEANDMVRDFFNEVFYNWPKSRVVKNPRREFLHGLRGFCVKRREKEREYRKQEEEMNRNND